MRAPELARLVEFDEGTLAVVLLLQGLRLVVATQAARRDDQKQQQL